MGRSIMHAKDAVSAKMADCYITINGERFNFMQALNLEVNVEKTKVEIPILGKTGMGNKATGWIGTGSATFYYNNSIFRKLLAEYKETGKDIYFDMQITNFDETADVGRQTIVLIDCNVNGGLLAKYEAGGEVIEEEMEFTFEDWKMPEEFTNLEGM